MKKLFLMIVVVVVALSFSGAAYAAGMDPMGPAPNSGDGIPDGSGFESPIGPNGGAGSGSGPQGPAPNSGDGIPDGSGF
jgi:hypothetical protein